VNLQLDTTVSFHKVLQCSSDPILDLYKEARKDVDSVHASTFTKKEFAFSLISDCCSLQAHLFSKCSFIESWKWIEQYGSFRKRFAGRMRNKLLSFILKEYGRKVECFDNATKDKILALRLLEYLRVVIPELWERFDECLDLPLDNRTKCPFATIGPIEHAGVFRLKKKNTCDGSEGCVLINLLRGKDGKHRGMDLLQELKKISDDDPVKSKELKIIESFLESFYEKGQHQTCYEMCNRGIGDLVIALETFPYRTLLTTNAKEFVVICKSIKQNLKVLSSHTETGG